MHHCGSCGACGGDIPCGELYTRRWRRGGECPGHIRTRGEWSALCGALLEVRQRTRPRKGACSV